jgi:glycolate dehydrogenase FAD-binding subunit
MMRTDVGRILLDPANVEELASLLARAARERKRVAIEGGGTKIGWGSPAAAADITLSTRRLNRVVAHRFGDLTATVEAGASLAAVNRELARHGQWIPLDPPWADRATIGGILATNDSGPRRHRFGAPRDLIIGSEIVCIDGTIAKSGGIVVKNVAGYDVGRLMTGSFGSLAVIASATFKLYPIPPASRTVVVEAANAAPIVAALTSSQLTPTAIEIATSPLRLLVRVESIEAAAEEQAAEIARMADSHGGAPTILARDEEAAVWEAHSRRPWTGAGAVMKITFLPTELAPTLAWLADTLRDIEWELIGRAAIGVALVRIGGDASRQARIVTDLRARFPVGRGSLVIVRGSEELKRAVDPWGPAGDSLALMRAVKQQFDPDGLLNPGRGPFAL